MNMVALRVLAACGWFFVLVALGIYVWNGGSVIADIRAFIAQAPAYAFLFFLIAYAVRPIILVPDSVMLVIGGAAFGPLLGFLGGYIGENVSALIAFSISRFLGNKYASRSHIAFVRKLDAAVSRRGFRTLMFLRLIPIAPFDPINYGAGLTSMSYRTFIAGTALGVIPALAVYVLLGSAIANPKFILVAVIIMTFISVKLFAIRKIAPDIFAVGTHHHRR